MSGDTLKCPRCKGIYLHHGVVSVFHREIEDRDTTAIVIDGWTARVVVSSPDNPSERRDGVSIAFTCEDCLFTGNLRIIQHKGVTLVNWSDD